MSAPSSSMLLAAAAPPAFMGEIVALIAASAAVAYVCHRFRILPIVSFLVTGAIVGPHALRLVEDEAIIEAAAEIGVILLLFTIGIEFSLEKLARIKRIIFLGGGLQTGLVIALVTGVLAAVGVDWRTGVFTGCLVALSSTAIVMKLLMGAGDMGSQEGRAALGILIFQDLVVVAMVLLVPILGGAGESGWAIGVALGKAVVIVTLVVLVARRVMPRVLNAVAKTCSQEIFLLSVVAICLGTAFLTSLAGVSLSLGAFLAGLIVSESRFRHVAFGEILPLQILFSAMFFVSVGLLLDLSFLARNLPVILAAVGAVLVIKTVTTGVGLKVLGYRTGAAAASALILAQVGEFSFVLERSGREAGLFPGGWEAGGSEAFIGATVVLMIATPLLYRIADGIRNRQVPVTGIAIPDYEPALEPGEGGGELTDHVIVAGMGDGARALVPVLDEWKIDYVILTLSPEGAQEAQESGWRVLSGNYTRQHELTLGGIRTARLLVVADDDFETTHRVVAAARALNPELQVMARCRKGSEVRELREAGATEVVSEEQESLVRLLTRVMEESGLGSEDIGRHQDALRQASRAAPSGAAVTLTATQRDTDLCGHTAQTTGVEPSTPGCQECLELGGNWVHLRICMTCGHVGCCDSSPKRHATKHFQATDHPIVKSLEHGEDWAWCYQDEVTF